MNRSKRHRRDDASAKAATGESSFPPGGRHGAAAARAGIGSSVLILIAVVGFVALTLAPTAYRFSLESRDPADFPALTEKLAEIDFAPPGWNSEPGTLDLTDEWKERLGMKYDRSEELVSENGERMHVLMMLSENGEQLMHTPDVCYAAVGCEVRGDVASVTLPQAEGDMRTVQIEFDRLTGGDSRVVAFGYWSDGQWISPSPTIINNVLGRETYLVKFQILIDGDRPDDAELVGRLDDYLEFLAKQLKEKGV